MDEPISQIKPTDLRGILNYVPRFLGQTFVVSFDGSIIEHENLPNLLLDIAVLRSLQINIVIVHGIGKQLAELSQSRSIPISSADGNGPTDAATLDLAIRASSRVSHQILEALTQNGLKCAITNSVRSKQIGILKGQDFQYSGKVDRVDHEFLSHLIHRSIIPIIQPIGFDRNGHTLRINSDLLAIEVAQALKATKLLYLCSESGLTIDNQLSQQLPVGELEAFLQSESFASLSPNLQSKARHALLGVKHDIARIHILDGRIHDGLIREVFSNEGVGTLIYGNEYQQIRQATRADVNLIYHLTRSSVSREELASRSIEAIEESIDRYFLYEIDGNIIACVRLTRYAEAPETMEINSLFVHDLYQRRGVGKKLVKFACNKARSEGATRVLALSTQSAPFFTDVCGFAPGSPDALPPSRLASYRESQRASKVLVKEL